MRGKGKNNGLKFFIIIFTLVVPATVYVFLRGFGENHYAVPVFYENGLSRDTTECPSDNLPHTVHMSLLPGHVPGDHPADIFDDKLSVIDVDMEPGDRLGNSGYSLNRVSDIFARNPAVQFIFIRPDQGVDHVKQSPANERFIYVYGTDREITEFARCELVLFDFPDEIDRENRRFVLIDNRGKIRGYYPSGDFDEIDRMVLEIKIILKEEFE